MRFTLFFFIKNFKKILGFNVFLKLIKVCKAQILTSRELVGIDAKEPLLKHMREIYSTKNKFYN